MPSSDHPPDAEHEVPSAHPSKRKRVRLDEYVVACGLAQSRSQAQRLIMAGDILIDGVPAAKPGQLVVADASLELRGASPYVSRGGLKLEAALVAFGIDPAGWVCADVGASTGGFTDCLLQRGASRVYAIDVGYGQLAWTLRQDARVVNLERTNVRYLPDLPEPVALATVDVSFISLRLVLPKLAALLKADGQVVALIKPQFEVGKSQVGKGGVVRDPMLHRTVLAARLADAASLGLAPAGLIRSPLRGPAGNIEFLTWLRNGRAAPDDSKVQGWITSVTEGY